MNCKLWLTLCCAALLAASLPEARALQPDNVLPPPPGVGPSPAPAQAQAPSPAQAPAAACAPQTITCTVMVPQISYKTITVPDVVCKPEVRQKNVTVCRMVAETQMVNCSTTIVVPERRTAMKTFTTCHMTYESAARQVTVMVPHAEMRQGVRTVCKPVASQEMQTVCKDMGQWTTQTFVDCCGCAGTCQVWAPKMVTEQVAVTVYKPQFIEEAFEYQEVVCRPELRTINEQIAKPVYETQTREVSYFVPVCKQVERQIPRTTFRPVTEERVVNYTVMVPERVERQVQVPVCTLVAKQVTYSVPACGSCGCGW